MTKHKWAKEIHAFADGQEIQGRSHGEAGTWIKLSNPNWASDWEFRIKQRAL